MTEKRFYIAKSNLIEGYCVFDREKKYAFSPRLRKADCLNDTHILNELHEENTEYKRELDDIYLLIGKGDWSGLVDLLICDEKSKTK